MKPAKWNKAVTTDRSGMTMTILASSFAKALLNPESIALIGASGDVKKNTARPLRFMRKHNYRGSVYPVNPTRSTVQGETAYPNLESIGRPVEHAFVMVPREQVSPLLDECARAGVKVVTIYSDGFGETGKEGQKLQDALVTKARKLGLRLLGPNSIGVANIASGSIISVNAAFEAHNLKAGGVSLVSQSGSMMGSVLSRAAARGFGFAKSISVGNESDISVGEIIDALADDPQTQVILLFLETIRESATMARALWHARHAGKPVIAYKLGRSEQGNELAQSHTGAIAGSDSAIDAFLRKNGVMRVGMLETLFEIIPMAVRYHRLKPVRGATPRVAVITTTGGGAGTVVDNLGVLGVEAVAPPQAFVDNMAGRGLKIRPTKVIDLTLAATSAQYRDLLEQLLSADWCDAVLSVVGSSAQFQPELAVLPLAEAQKAYDKPLAVFLAPDAPASLALLQSHDVAVFRTPESCADALATFLKRSHEQYANGCMTEVSVVWPRGSGDAAMLTEFQAALIFQQLGIETAESQVITDKDQEHSLPYPVVVKVCSAEIPHKTDVGGVERGIQSAAALAASIQRILSSLSHHAPDARIDGFLVQKTEERLLELMLGYRNDPLVGPTVVLGAGGVAAELSQDFSIRIAPIDIETAHEMIAEVSITKLIRNFRGLPEGDVDGLAHAISAFSKLACITDRTIEEAEINPLFVQRNKVIAVDALLRLARPAATS